jgi:hypothetical protein
MTMRSLFRLLAITALMSMSLTSASFAGTAKATKSIAKMHRVAIQVDQNDAAIMNLALNNATNIFEYYLKKGEAVEVNIVTYGPGLHMLRDTSPVQATQRPRVSRQDPVFGMQQHQAGHGEARGPVDRYPA